MKTEEELRELHGRLVGAISFARSIGTAYRDLRDLMTAKLQLEWILGMNTRAAEGWQASTFHVLNNMEGLKRTHERSREAAEN